jgi:low affinity Fe/Cu permease
MIDRKGDTSSATERFASWITVWSGSTAAIVGSLAICVGWAVTGPIFHYSDAWQLVINSVTNIATFVMVFLIQRAQNKDSLAVQLKLNELIAAKQGASNRAIAIDQLSEEELHRLHDRYMELSRGKSDQECRESTSIPFSGSPTPAC